MNVILTMATVSRPAAIALEVSSVTVIPISNWKLTGRLAQVHLHIMASTRLLQKHGVLLVYINQRSSFFQLDVSFILQILAVHMYQLITESRSVDCNRQFPYNSLALLSDSEYMPSEVNQMSLEQFREHITVLSKAFCLLGHCNNSFISFFYPVLEAIIQCESDSNCEVFCSADSGVDECSCPMGFQLGVDDKSCLGMHPCGILFLLYNYVSCILACAHTLQYTHCCWCYHAMCLCRSVCMNP